MSTAGSTRRYRPASSSAGAGTGLLSARKVNEIHSALASARKPSSSSRPPSAAASHSRDNNLNAAAPSAADKGKARARSAPQTAGFIAETSFVDAPLNSRIAPSPRRKGAATLAVSSDSDDNDDADQPGAAENVRARAQRDGLDRVDLAAVPRELQEALIVEDLLFVLMGIEGLYIEFEQEYDPQDDFERLIGPACVIDPSLDPSLAALAARFLPLATSYISISTFITLHSSLSFGPVNHALCASLRAHMKDYLVLLSRLESAFENEQGWGLQSMWWVVQEAAGRMEVLKRATEALVKLNTTVQAEGEEDESTSLDGSDSDGGFGGAGLKAVLSEMKASDKASSSKGGAGTWAQGFAQGGEVIAVLSALLTQSAGSPLAGKIYASLLHDASVPYLAVLLGWIERGTLEDEEGEFIVREMGSITRGELDRDYTDEYWDKRYTLRDAAAPPPSSLAAVSGAEWGEHRRRGLAGGAVVPPQLEPWKTKILLAGKYLNVIRECGREVDASTPGQGSATPRVSVGVAAGRELAQQLPAEANTADLLDPAFYKRVDAAYVHANRTLLDLLLTESDLLSRLRSIKSFFFIDHGDSFTHFLDLAAHELGKKAKVVSVLKLQSLLDLALRTPASASATDPWKEDLKVGLSKENLTDWLIRVVHVSGALPDAAAAEGAGDEDRLTGLETAAARKEESSSGTLSGIDALTLDYNVKFPLSLVVSRKTILRYQLVFRHLLRLKHIEMILGATWLEHTKSPVWRTVSKHPVLEDWKKRCFALRARMLFFVKQMYAFAVIEVLEPNWRALVEKLDTVRTVDGLLKHHVDFLDACLKECMLTNEKLLLTINKLLTTCSIFVSYTSQFSQHAQNAVLATEQAGGDPSGVSMQKSFDFFQKFERNFDYYVQHLILHLKLAISSENSTLIALQSRLSSLERPAAADQARRT